MAGYMYLRSKKILLFQKKVLTREQNCEKIILQSWNKRIKKHGKV